MSYINDTLINGEEIIYEGKLSIWSLVPQVLLAVVFLLCAAFTTWLCVILSIVMLIWAYILYISTELAFTNKRVIAKYGFIQRATVELNIGKVESIQVHQSILGRIFDYGSIVVSGAGNPQAPIAGISKPMVFRNKFMEYTNK